MAARIIHPGSPEELLQGQIVQVTVTAMASQVEHVRLNGHNLTFVAEDVQTDEAEFGYGLAIDSCCVSVVIDGDASFTEDRLLQGQQQLQVMLRKSHTIACEPPFFFKR